MLNYSGAMCLRFKTQRTLVPKRNSDLIRGGTVLHYTDKRDPKQDIKQLINIWRHAGFPLCPL